MRREALVRGQERDFSKGALDLGPVSDGGGTDGERGLSQRSPQRFQNRPEIAGFAGRDEFARLVMRASEDLAVEEVGDGQNALGPSPGRPGRDIGGERSETRLLPGESPNAGQRDSKPGEGTWTDDRGEEIDIARTEAHLAEHRVDRGKKPLGVPVIRLERPRREDGFAAREGDAPEGGGRVEGEYQGGVRRRGDGRH